jgi:hypothetical protein
MGDAELLKFLGGGSLAAALLALIYLVGMRLVAAIGALVQEIREHTKVDLAHHAEVRAAVIAMHSKIDTLVEWQERTPVETPIPQRPRARSEITPVGPGGYSVHRKKPGE